MPEHAPDDVLFQLASPLSPWSENLAPLLVLVLVTECAIDDPPETDTDRHREHDQTDDDHNQRPHRRFAIPAAAPTPPPA